MDAEREREIAQGLRAPDGGLIGGLHVFDYVQGFDDAEAGRPPPDFSTTSYDLGRQLYWRRQEEAERTRKMLAEINAENDRRIEAVRQIVMEAGRPDVLAKFDADLAALKPREGE